MSTDKTVFDEMLDDFQQVKLSDFSTPRTISINDLFVAYMSIGMLVLSTAAILSINSLGGDPTATARLVNIGFGAFSVGGIWFTLRILTAMFGTYGGDET